MPDDAKKFEETVEDAEIRILASDESKPQWGCVAAFLIVLVPFVLCCRVLSPSDWVDVTIGRILKDTLNWCLIAEDSRGVGSISWYDSKVTPFTTDPFHGGSFQRGTGKIDDHGFVTDSVQWREAKRYGILIQRQDDSWRLFWLEPGEISRPSIGRFLMGGGYAKMDLPDEIRAQVPSTQLLKRLGFSELASTSRSVTPSTRPSP